jgi:hypothetical protein
MLGDMNPVHGRPNMKTISMMAAAAAIAISALSFTATPGAAKTAKAGTTTPPEHYCLSYEAGSSVALQATRNARQWLPASAATADKMQVIEHGSSRRTGDEPESQIPSAIIMRRADAAAYPCALKKANQTILLFL